MKKLLAIAAAAAAFFAFAPAEAQAGHPFRGFGHCNTGVHSFHRPVRHSYGHIRYRTVPVYRSTSYRSSCSSRRTYTPVYRSINRSYHPTYRSYRRTTCNRGPSVAIHFGRSSFLFR